MAILLSNYLPNLSEDVVKITSGSGEDERQVFVGETSRINEFGFAPFSGSFIRGVVKAQPLKANIERNTQGFSHPLEDSTTLVDHRIILPIVITIPFLIIRDYNNAIYEEIDQFFNSGETVTVYTKARKYNNLYIDSIPHEEVPDRSDAILVNVIFREIQVAAPTVTNFNPLSTEQSSATERGVIDFIDIALANLTVNL